MVTFKEFLLLDAAQLSEMYPSRPAVQDQVDKIMNHPDEYGSSPTNRRKGQRAGRRLRADGYKGDRRNAQEYPSEEEIADMERGKRFQNKVNSLGRKSYQDAIASQPNEKRFSQENVRSQRSSYGREEEMETKEPAHRELNRAMSKSNLATPQQTKDPKRRTQQYNRLKRRFGYEDEMEASLPAQRDRSAGNRNAEPYNGREANPSMKRQIQGADRHERNTWGLGHKKGAKTL